jgi:8-oxo-dGTP diphosphatase
MQIATDLVICRGRKILFIRRLHAPFEGKLALPGGFLEQGETVEAGAVRELEEETSLRLPETALRLVGVFSAIDRDPRQRVISIAYRCDVPSRTKARAGDDAADAVWLTREEALKIGLAFDHADILAAAL